jgi:predicted O-methyltransferase YrrM
VLNRLHAQADRQQAELLRVSLLRWVDLLLGRSITVEVQARRFRNLFIPLSPETGTFAYLVARSINAQRVVEFGTSFGISTIYLAAAVRDNGGGIVIGSEIEEGKIEKAKENIAEAALSQYVEIRAGDARETLEDPGGKVDMVLLDGWKEFYVPIVRRLTPHLRCGAVVLADNIKTFPKALAPYVAHMSDLRNGFHTVTLPLGAGTEYSVRL